MKKAPWVLILFSLIVIALLYSFGSVAQSPKSNEAIVEVDQDSKSILITPSGNSDIIIVDQVLKTKGIKINSIMVGGELRTDFTAIVVPKDYDKDIVINLNNFWGAKDYKIKLVLTNFVKFHVDGEVVKVVNKNDVAAFSNFPEGDYEWFLNDDFTRPYDPITINSVYSLYAKS